MKNSKPLVAIITPTYNQAEFIPETIESVLRQDYPSIKYMVFDGGSTDSTLDILKSYGDRFYWVSEKDKGQADAINKGWRRAKSPIIAYLNSDDTYYVDSAVSLAVEVLESRPDVGIVFGDSVYIDKDGNEIGTYNAYPFEYDRVFSECLNPIPQPSVFLRWEVIDKIGYLDDNLQYSMDLDLWLRAGLHYKIEYLPEILATFRLHPQSKSVSAMAKAAPEIIYIYQKILSDPRLPGHLRIKEREIMGRAYLLSARQYFAGGDLDKARKSFRKSFALNKKCMEVRDFVKFMLSSIPDIGIHVHKLYY